MTISLKNVSDASTLEIYSLDPEHSMELVRSEALANGDEEIILDLPIYTTLLLKLKK